MKNQVSTQESLTCDGCGKQVTGSWKLSEQADGKRLCENCEKFPCPKCGKRVSKAKGGAEGRKCKACLEQEHAEQVRFNAVATFTFEPAKDFKTILEAISVLDSEPTFEVSRDKIALTTLDPSRVAMIRLTLEKRAFTEWQVHSEGYMQVDIDQIIKELGTKQVKKDTKVNFFIDGKDEKLTMTLKDGKATRVRRYSLFPISEKPVQPPKPKITYTTTAKLIAQDFLDDLTSIAKKADHVQLEGSIDRVRLVFVADTQAGFDEYKKGSDTLLDIEAREDAKATYSLSYLKELIRPNLCDLVVISWATDMPIKVVNQGHHFNIAYHLAPRIEAD